MQDSLTPDAFSLQVDNSNIPYLSEAARWGKFLGILGFVICGLLVLTGVFAGTILQSSFSQVDPELSNMGSFSGIVITIWCVLTALLYFFPSLYLFNFASKMQMALRNNDQVNLNAAFQNLKSCFKFWGILLIIILSIYAVAIIFSVLAGAFF